MYTRASVWVGCSMFYSVLCSGPFGFLWCWASSYMLAFMVNVLISVFIYSRSPVPPVSVDRQPPLFRTVIPSLRSLCSSPYLPCAHICRS
ncbi:hypothetical protein V8D89_012854 [Ganoderma adspersum]